MPPGQSPGPAASQQAKQRPNRCRLETRAGRQPIKGVLVEELFAENLTFDRPAMAQKLPTLAPPQTATSSRSILPRARGDQARQYQADPRRAMDDQHRITEPVRLRFEYFIPGRVIGITGAGQLEFGFDLW